MSTIYITTQGASVYKFSGQFVVQKGKEVLQNVPETQVKQMILLGNINLSTPAISFCLENQIEVVFLSQGGKFKGRLNAFLGRNAEIRRRQYELTKDTDFCLQQVRAIVAGKINNQMAVCLRQNDVLAAEKLKNFVRKAQIADSPQSLLGIEGAASVLYFKLFRGWIPQPWTFEKRTANPPKDEVNALLSLSYTLIYNRLETNLTVAGLDAYQGFFHQVRNGHAALASDLTEEFRSVFADALVLKLIRRKQLKPSDFDKTAEGFRLTKEGSKVFFGEFERKMASKRKISETENLSYTEIMKRQVYHLARVIGGTDAVYKPFRIA
jgi:CRISPR-associated protein Cas1